MGSSEEEISDYVYGDLKEEPWWVLAGHSVRRAMQTLGTDWGRDRIDHDLWVLIMVGAIADALQEGDRVVIDDMRMKNEMDMLVEEFNACTIRVVPVSPDYSDVLYHVSEGNLDFEEFDHIITNDGDLSELQQKVRKIFDIHGE